MSTTISNEVTEVSIGTTAVEIMSDIDNQEVCVTTPDDLDISIAKREFIVTGDNIYIHGSGSETPQWLVDAINNIADLATAKTLEDLKAAMNSINAALLEAELARNTYTESIMNEATIEGIVVQKLETINATLKDMAANVINLERTKATPEEAEALAIQHINSQINSGEIHSLITDLNTTIANNIQTTATNIETLESVFNDNVAILEEADRTLATETAVQAERVTTLKTELYGPDGEIGGSTGYINEINQFVGLDPNTPEGMVSLSEQIQNQEAYLFPDGMMVPVLEIVGNKYVNKIHAKTDGYDTGIRYVDLNLYVVNKPDVYPTDGQTYTTDDWVPEYASDAVLTKATDIGGALGGNSVLMDTIKVTADKVETNFEYGSNIVLDGQTYKSGFGLKAEATTGSGTDVDPYDSEFWVNADKFRFVQNSTDDTGKDKVPFAIDKYGNTKFQGVVTFGSGQTGTIDEAIASTVNTIAVGDKNINVTDNLVPITSLVGDVNNSGYQFIGTPVSSVSVGADVFAEPQISLPSNTDEVYSPYIKDMYSSYYYKFAIKPGTDYTMSVVQIDGDTYTTTAIPHNATLVNDKWYIVEGLIQPSTSTNSSFGIIREADTLTQVGTVEDILLNSATDWFVLGWTGTCTISQIKIAKMTSDTVTGIYADVDYVDESVQYALDNDVTTIIGNTVTTGYVNALNVHAASVDAENITGTTITGKTISGAYIEGGVIYGAHITAGSLRIDADSGTALLTDYKYATSSAKNAIEVATTEYYVNGWALTTRALVSSVGTYFTAKTGIYSYDSYNVATSNRATKASPALDIATTTVFTGSYVNNMAYYTSVDTAYLTFNFNGATIAFDPFFPNGTRYRNDSPAEDHIVYDVGGLRIELYSSWEYHNGEYPWSEAEVSVVIPGQRVVTTLTGPTTELPQIFNPSSHLGSEGYGITYSYSVQQPMITINNL